jgi:hypothetical protein
MAQTCVLRCWMLTSGTSAIHVRVRMSRQYCQLVLLCGGWLVWNVGVDGVGVGTLLGPEGSGASGSV